MASLRLTSITVSMACSWMSTRPLRGCPSESNAPALISDSMTRLLQTLTGTLRRKSAKLVNAPLAVRAATIASTTLVPTLRTAARPNLMSLADRGEHRRRGVHVRRQHLDAHPAALVQVQGRLVLVARRPR